MKKFVIILVILSTTILACSTKKSKEQSILEKIASAHGFENWKNINEIQFTFNVDRDTTHFERSWTWNPKTNNVIATSDKEIISYNRSQLDSITQKTNSGFINDKFWLLAPYQLIWDANNIKYDHSKIAEAPISKTKMQKLTIIYGAEGGYTPGDAYDFYFAEDFIIQEWVFRKANQTEPSMTTTFEDYKMVNGLQLATMHKMNEGNFKLYFTNLQVN